MHIARKLQEVATIATLHQSYMSEIEPYTYIGGRTMAISVGARAGLSYLASKRSTALRSAFDNVGRSVLRWVRIVETGRAKVTRFESRLLGPA